MARPSYGCVTIITARWSYDMPLPAAISLYRTDTKRVSYDFSTTCLPDIVRWPLDIARWPLDHRPVSVASSHDIRSVSWGYRTIFVITCLRSTGLQFLKFCITFLSIHHKACDTCKILRKTYRNDLTMRLLSPWANRRLNVKPTS